MQFKRFALTILTFLLILTGTFAKPKKPVLPQEVMAKIEATEASTSTWSICEHKKKSIKKTLIGPLETEEAAYAVWIYLDLEPKKTFCVAKNETFRTDSPNSFKQDLFSIIALNGQKYGKDRMLAHYILGEPLVPVQKVEETKTENNAESAEITESSQSTAPAENNPSENTEQANTVVLSETETAVSIPVPDTSDIKIPVSAENINFGQLLSVTIENLTGIKFEKIPDFESLKNKKIEPAAEETITAEIPVESGKENDYNFVLTTPEPKKNNSYSGYEKEYLQDYAPKKHLIPPKAVQEQEELIDEPDTLDKDGKSLLMKAVLDSDFSKVRLLIKSGANINLTDKDGWSALMYAARYQTNIFIVQELIAAGADVKHTNNYGISALYLSAGYGLSSDILSELLRSYTPQEKDVLKAFVLLLTDNSCTEELKIQKIECFINKNIRLNNFYNGKTPLQYACLYGNSTNIINLLISRGCDINVRSTEGKTAFDYACENKALTRDDNFWKLNQI